MKVTEVLQDILIKLSVAILISFVISIVSFRQLWMTDVFHIVFLANLLTGPITRRIQALLQ